MDERGAMQAALEHRAEAILCIAQAVFVFNRRRVESIEAAWIAARKELVLA
jgi:hypothetical protein